MSKYIKLEDVIKTYADSKMCKHIFKKKGLDLVERFFADLPTIEVSEENELKFYYVESIDDYWIGEEVIAIWDDGIDGAELYEVQKLVRCENCIKSQTWKCPFYRAGYTYRADDFCKDGEWIEE